MATWLVGQGACRQVIEELAFLALVGSRPPCPEPFPINPHARQRVDQQLAVAGVERQLVFIRPLSHRRQCGGRLLSGQTQSDQPTKIGLLIFVLPEEMLPTGKPGLNGRQQMRNGLGAESRQFGNKHPAVLPDLRPSCQFRHDIETARQCLVRKSLHAKRQVNYPIQY